MRIMFDIMSAVAATSVTTTSTVSLFPSLDANGARFCNTNYGGVGYGTYFFNSLDSVKYANGARFYDYFKGQSDYYYFYRSFGSGNANYALRYNGLYGYVYYYNFYYSYGSDLMRMTFRITTETADGLVTIIAVVVIVPCKCE